MNSSNKTVLEQILVPGIIDYNTQFIEAYEREVYAEGIQQGYRNSNETVIMKMSDISSVYVEKGSQYLYGDPRIIIVTLQNKFRYSFTYETGNAIRMHLKRCMKNPGTGFNFEDDRRYLSKIQ